MAIKIGFTERGDAGVDQSWYEKCKAGACDGLIAITKRLTPGCREKILDLHASGFPVILHCGCTGWGGTKIEPKAYEPLRQLHALQGLLNSGFPAKNVVLRIDPIIPTVEGLRRVEWEVMPAALGMGILPECRVRISIIDMYPHVRERFAAAGEQSPYGEFFSPSVAQLRLVQEKLKFFGRNYGIRFETCAETALCALDPDLFVEQGCISETDLAIMGLEYDGKSINPQRRGGCRCLGCKTELLEHKQRCPVGCLYCYWRDASPVCNK